MKTKLILFTVIIGINLVFSNKILAAKKGRGNEVTQQVEEALAGKLIANKIKIKEFKITGNTIYSTDILERLLSEYIGKELSFSLLIEVTNILTKYYSEAGYISSFAEVVSGDLSKGEITIAITEGKISRVDVDLTGFLSEEYVRARILAKFKKRAFNINTLKEITVLLQNDNNIDTLNIEVDAEKDSIATTVLKVTVIANPVATIVGQFSNSRSSFIGSNEAIGQAEIGILGLGDKLSILLSGTQGSTGLGINYNIPIKIEGNLNLFYGKNNNTIVEEPFDVGIESDADYFNIRYSHQLINKPLNNLSVGIIGSYAETSDRILGRKFQLNRGADEQGELRVTALRFPVQYFWRDENNIIQISTELNLGLPNLFGATKNDRGQPDSNFAYGRSSFEYVHIFQPDSFFYLKGKLELSKDSLPSLEQISFGGIKTGRGYSPSTGIGDNGFSFSAEYRYPLWRHELKKMRLQLVPFIDFGKVWNISQDDPQLKNLLSTGLGLNFSIDDRLDISLFYAEPLAGRNNPNISNRRFGFSISGKVIEF